MHEQAYDFVARHATGSAPVDVLEIGSHDVNGSVRPLFPGAVRFHGLDIAPGPGVDEVADAADWRSPDSFDVVVSTEVLEHAPRWTEILHNAWESLRPAGLLLVTCATDPRPPHSAVDGWDVRPGEHYANIPASAAIGVLRDLGCDDWSVEVHSDRGDLYLRSRKPATTPPDPAPSRNDRATTVTSPVTT